MNNADRIYLIYGRKSYPQPLEFVESVAVTDGEDIPVPEGEDWVEVVAFPETAVTKVIPRTRERVA